MFSYCDVQVFLLFSTGLCTNKNGNSFITFLGSKKVRLVMVNPSQPRNKNNCSLSQLGLFSFNMEIQQNQEIHTTYFTRIFRRWASSV